MHDINVLPSFWSDKETNTGTSKELSLWVDTWETQAT